VTIFETNRVLANAEGIVYPEYRLDFLHLNPAGYDALNDALYELLVPYEKDVQRSVPGLVVAAAH
jgi:hypothetical protein